MFKVYLTEINYAYSVFTYFEIFHTVGKQPIKDDS